MKKKEPEIPEAAAAAAPESKLPTGDSPPQPPPGAAPATPDSPEPASFQNMMGSLARNEKLAQAYDASKRSAQGAWSSFMSFIINPFGGIESAYRNLGLSGALSVSIFFLAVYAIANIWTIHELKTLVIILMTFVPVAVAVGSLTVCRMLADSSETWHVDLFIASPIFALSGLSMALCRLASNYYVSTTLNCFVIAYTVYILFGGLNRILRISEAWAALAIPIIISLYQISISIAARAV